MGRREGGRERVGEKKREGKNAGLSYKPFCS